MDRVRSFVDPVRHSKAVSANLTLMNNEWKATGQWDAVRKKNRLASGMPDHVSAKTWTLRSPEGVIYKCSNLSEWARHNTPLFEETNPDAKLPLWRRIVTGFSMTLAANSPTKSYKGWTVVDQDHPSTKVSIPT